MYNNTSAAIVATTIAEIVFKPGTHMIDIIATIAEKINSSAIVAIAIADGFSFDHYDHWPRAKCSRGPGSSNLVRAILKFNLRA